MDKNIIDIEFTEAKDTSLESQITEELDKSKIYYTISQAARLLGLEVGKLRYYSNFFALDSDGRDLIKISYSNKNRAYTQENIKQFKRILTLMEDGMTLQQTRDYVSLNGFDEVGKTLDSSNPLALTAFVSELNSDMQEKLENFEKSLLKKIMLLIDHGNSTLIETSKKENEYFLENISKTVDEVITKEIKENLDGRIENLTVDIIKRLEEQNQVQIKINEEQTKIIESLNKRLEQRDIDMCSVLKDNLEKQQELYRKVSEKKNLFKSLKEKFGFK
ncbi:helix-turn-helix domain-containing protein [Clostridium perfringens]|uniref:helix-turn-helix domain-containing protein n=1 Tax=Clostridium perfringens TaxID=1502 RepID=UPI002245557C|nr:helix-turn-helix domain-containing protein [Clostridium perfringens]MCX0396179.1 helix-turn-helix domain-containing protein [Clostridium perfringens]